jgi:transcriptional regulator with XRE-family HTH domain
MADVHAAGAGVRVVCEEETMPSRDPGRNPRQVFGAMVRFYREQAGLSRSELARQICKSVSLIQAIELGQRAATAEVTSDLEAALQAGGALAQLRDEIGDGLGYQAYPSWFADWPGMEASATRLRFYGLAVVPGLLQTEDYARAVFRTRFGATDEEVDERVAARLKRQEILDRDQSPLLWIILDEAVLRRPVGGRHVMAEQVRRIADAAQRANIRIEIIAASVGAHEGAYAGGFAIADFEAAPSVGYQEAAAGGQTVEEAAQVAVLSAIWDSLTGEALPRAASLGLLEEAAKRWTQAA